MDSEANTVAPKYEPDDEYYVTIFRRFKLDENGNKVFPKGGKRCFAMRVLRSSLKAA